MQERRSQQRSRTYLNGQVAFRQRYCALDCLVRDLSPDGARLVFQEESVLPAKFEFVIPHKNDSRPARIVWRKRTDVGIEFLDYAEDRPSLDIARQLKSLNEKNAALKRRVAELSESAC
jgi:hypothetical protein